MAKSKSHTELIKPYRVEKGSKFRLKDYDPGDTQGLKSEFKPEALRMLRLGVSAISKLQEKLYAQNQWGLLLIFQAMDAAGKDGTIKHVMSGVNPQGAAVYSFKAPSLEDLDHDYLWRAMKRAPARGQIAIFNRSYYEEVLVVRVHPGFLKKQQIPPRLIGKKIWKERYEDINAYEHFLSRNGFIIRKFFLHVSRKEQKRRFMERLNLPEKNWKFSESDVKERGYWNQYMEAYEDAIRATSKPYAPWYVVPADNKWFTRMVVAAAIVDAMEGLGLAFPKVDQEKLKHLQAAKQLLEAE